jgi:uncharacterized protein (DUF1778 family)
MPKVKKVGRPRLPKGAAKGKIVPVRLDAEDLGLATAAAKHSKQALSEWIRDTLRNAAEEAMYQRTLHEAMRIVLNERQTATTSELSEEIDRRGLYSRKDGTAAKAQQINARARKYPELFEIDSSGSVRLSSNSLASVRIS